MDGKQAITSIATVNSRYHSFIWISFDYGPTSVTYLDKVSFVVPKRRLFRNMGPWYGKIWGQRSGNFIEHKVNCRFHLDAKSCLGWFLHHRVHHVMSFFHSIIHSFNSIQFNSIQFNSIHQTSLHITSRHFTSIHLNSLHFTSLHFNSLQFTSLQFTSLQFINSFIHSPGPISGVQNRNPCVPHPRKVTGPACGSSAAWLEGGYRGAFADGLFSWNSWICRRRSCGPVGMHCPDSAATNHSWNLLLRKGIK